MTRARELGLAPERLDSHRHAAFAPPVFRAVCAEARALGIEEVRRSNPLGTMRMGGGPAGFAKGALLFVAGLATRGVPRAFGLASADGVADLERVDRWASRGRWPAGLLGARVEAIAHPARGAADVSRAERGPDRAGDATRLAGLRERMESVGAIVVDGRSRSARPDVRSAV